MRQRKTIDCWRFYVNYGSGPELECIEFTRGAMITNRNAYRENCSYPLDIKFGRFPVADMEPDELAKIEADKQRERAERIAKRTAARQGVAS